ncbi:MAG: 50S ribosomal protein L30 [Legionellales bacterium]|nr:MAG: 50S ribosomal protein L30 [Legionellales bacterium]
MKKQMQNNTVAVTLIKSAIGRKPDHVKTVIGLLGTTRMQRRKVLEDTPCVRGMIHKIAYMLLVEDQAKEETSNAS